MNKYYQVQQLLEKRATAWRWKHSQGAGGVFVRYLCYLYLPQQGQPVPSLSTSSTFAWIFAANIGLINLNCTAQSIPAGADDHRTSDFMKPLPSCMIIAKITNALHAERIYSILLPGNYATLRAIVQVAFCLPVISRVAVGADKTVRPS